MLTRLAPSPTGALHLGNARTFLVNWLLARQHGWKILLRIEDLDGPRIKPQSAQQAIEDLQWLGLDWDEGPIYQSHRLPIYADAIKQLIASGDAYPCVCTRKEVELAASAPHAEDGAAVYPGTCRGRFNSIAEATAFAGRPPAIRFRVPDESVGWNDLFCRSAELLRRPAVGRFCNRQIGWDTSISTVGGGRRSGLRRHACCTRRRSAGLHTQADPALPRAATGWSNPGLLSPAAGRRSRWPPTCQAAR